MKKKTDDLTGQVFGWLTVTGRDTTRPRYWNCICDCGNEKSVRKDHLIDGSTQSCGCYRRLSKIKDIPIGSKWGRLTVIRRVDLTATWECLCDCGNTYIASGYHLRRGDINSCGCIKRIDVTGNKYGKLIAIARDDEFSKNHKFKHSYWHCKCECGNDITVYLGHLQNGHTNA